MPQHEECNSCYEDFEKSELGQDCVGCLYYNHHCPGASHKRKDTGVVIDAQFNITALKLILSLGSPLTSPSRSRLSVLKLKLVEDKVSSYVVLLYGVIFSD